MHATQIRECRWTTYLPPSVAVKGFNQQKEKAFVYEGFGRLEMMARIKNLYSAFNHGMAAMTEMNKKAFNGARS